MINNQRKIIIKPPSKEAYELAAKTRDLFKREFISAMLVPPRVDSFFITSESQTDIKEGLVVISYSGDEKVNVAKGFNNVRECWVYAIAIAEEAGLNPEECIDADVWEIDPQSSIIDPILLLKRQILSK